MEAPTTEASPASPRLLWLDLTRKCQLKCVHCYNASGPDGTHGTMSRENWIGVLDQAAEAGVRGVQFTGGEVTMHPDAPELISHALNLGLKVEVFSNLVHVTADWWDLLQRDGVTLATSYYSDQDTEHNAMTGRPSHRRTRANIEKATRLGIPVRVGVIVGGETQRASEGRQELEALGVPHIRVDHVRPFGRGAEGQAPNVGNLCGRCGTDRAAVGPTGEVSPCVFSGWLGVGNVKDTPLATILGSRAMAAANASIRSRRGTGTPEKGDPCGPDDTDDECSPGFPGSECTPRN
ncbi:radical SAM/SPASM domain-containing protein [Streptomyces sp. NBC_00878]|uniref:radical SAM/SPASM domain-containing protein n=1 Tax=Streptomyces sp. NBC_00878 TaxID=2975854 RepID=UPI00225579B5|nr:radical SAM/SPASM domain-containing protein [Streptomyces sp. NBC_00878]MCX4910165.1 radical SAM protein [Streptomyces sp. NBC_00878]